MFFKKSNTLLLEYAYTQFEFIKRALSKNKIDSVNLINPFIVPPLYDTIYLPLFVYVSEKF